MSQRIVIDPVTRIEGHAKITIELDDTGNVSDAHFHVTEFRGFERFCEGRPLGEMAGITARICGICPVSHLMASAKAGDQILAVSIPPIAEKLRRLMNLGQIIQSHALSFFHLSAPDLLLGFDAPPETRNIFGLAARDPDLARSGIRLRQFGQEIIASLGGQRDRQFFVVLAELVRSLLFRQVQVPEELPLRNHGDPKERMHDGVMRRNPVGSRVLGHILDAKRPPLPRQKAQDPFAGR